MYKDIEKQREANRQHAQVYRRRKGMIKGMTGKNTYPPNRGIYLIIILMVSLLINGFQFYFAHRHEIPMVSYVSYVGIDSRGHCVTGQEFLNYTLDNKHDIMNTAYAVEFFKNISKVVLVNKWEIKNDLSRPPEVKLVKPPKKSNKTKPGKKGKP